MVILGIDPGTARAGYGVVRRVGGGKFRHLESGLIAVSGESLGGKLVCIERGVVGLVEKYRVRLAGVEKLYFVRNQKTGMDVAQARGVVIATLARCGVPTREVAPTEVKLSITGNGRASKEAVAGMLGHFLEGFDGEGVLDDVTDALAVAITASGKDFTETDESFLG